MRPFKYLSALLLVALTGIYVFNRPAYLTGDGADYMAMIVSLAKTGRPYITPTLDDAYNEASAASGYRVKLQALREYPGVTPFKDKEGNYDLPHFWAYSLAAAIPYKLTSHFSPQPYWGFLIVHLFLGIGVAVIAWRLFGWDGTCAFLLLWLFSPAIWFGAHIHTEFFTFCLTTAFVMFLVRRLIMPAAICMALSSTQNPVFLPAVAVLGAWYFYVNWRNELRHRDLAWLAILGCITIAHPVYYLVRMGVINPLFLSKMVSFESRDLRYLLLPITDLNDGLLANWPLGVLLLLAAPFLVSMEQLKRNLLPLAAYGALVLYGASRTMNFNSGGSVFVTRYATWLLCLFFPLLLLAIRRITAALTGAPARSRATVAAWVAILLIVMTGVFNMRLFWPKRAPEGGNGPVAEFVLNHVPAVYDPIPEVFIEREVNELEGPFFNWICGTRDGRKLLIFPNLIPAGPDATNRIPGVGWEVNSIQLMQIVAERLAQKPNLRQKPDFYINVTAEEAAKIFTAPTLNPAQVITGTPADDVYFLRGWHRPEDWGRWSKRSDAALHFLWSGATPPKQLTLDFNYYLPPGTGTVTLDVILNGEQIWSGVHNAGGSLTIPLNGKPITKASVNTLVFNAHPLRSPDAFDGTADGRKLGLGLRHLRLE